MGFGGPIIKEGIILVISIVTLQNYYGDLGEVCGKYPGWVKVPGPFNIVHFVTQLTILFTYIERYGFLGARYKRGSNFSYLDCYTPKLLWRPRWVMWQVPRMGEVPRPFDICHFFTQLTILFTFIESCGFWGAHYKRSNFSYLDCYTPKLLWRPRWGMWQVPRMGESTGTFWYLPLFHPAHYSIYVYRDIWVLGVPL